MSESLTINGTEYVSANNAGKRFGYTGTYIIMLAKEGKVDGRKVGSRWYIDLGSVGRFVNDAKKVRAARNEYVSRERRDELRKHTRVLSNPRKAHSKALMETFAILVIGLAIGAMGYLGTTPAQYANVAQTNVSFFERLAVALYEFVSPKSSVTVNEVTIVPGTDDESLPAVTVGTTTHTALVIGPNEVMNTTTIDSIRESFSDDVSVSIDPDHPDTGIIIPHFKKKDGEAFRFIMVPVNTPGS
jgi:hypothetical protein